MINFQLPSENLIFNLLFIFNDFQIGMQIKIIHKIFSYCRKHSPVRTCVSLSVQVAKNNNNNKKK